MIVVEVAEMIKWICKLTDYSVLVVFFVLISLAVGRPVMREEGGDDGG